MRIQPIATNNNTNNTNFKKLKIDRPQEWDLDVMEAVINNKSVQAFAKYLAEKGRDLNVLSCMKPNTMIMVNFGEEWRIIAPGFYDGKKELLENLARFDYKYFLKKFEAEKALKNRCSSLLAQVDEFNKQLEQKAPAVQPAESQKKRTFFQRLFGLNKS